MGALSCGGAVGELAERAALGSSFCAALAADLNWLPGGQVAGISVGQPHSRCRERHLIGLQGRWAQPAPMVAMRQPEVAEITGTWPQWCFQLGQA